MVVLGGLTACAPQTPLVAMPPKAQVQADAQANPTETRWSGRLVLKLAAFGDQAAQGVNIAFDLQGAAQQGQLDLSTPMGTLIAQVRWQQATATMSTADGTQAYDSLDALTRQILGESLPVTAMLSWLQGHAAPDQPWSPLSVSADRFQQAGWEVDLSALDQGSVLAQRPATSQQRGVTLRLRLDR